MSDLISREELYKRTVNKNSVWLSITNSEGKNLKEIVKEIPSADIMECAREIKEYCRDRDNLDEPCEGCPFHFYVGYRGYCRFESLPAEWDLPEGEKE